MRDSSSCLLGAAQHFEDVEDPQKRPIVCGTLNATGTASAWSTSVQPILDQGDSGMV